MATKHGGVEVIQPLMSPKPIDDTGLNSHFRTSSNVNRSASMASPRRKPVPIQTRQRGGSLTERFPGDESHKPLDIIRRDSKRAHRSPHLKKRHIPGADQIDRLDPTMGSLYHHEGPYDAALLARNTSYEHSPLAALTDTNDEAIRATPRENIIDAVQRHRPLDGVAIIPPGQKDRFGRTYNYKEGSNMMTEAGGDYKRWPGIEYHPDDIKGKGEPSYSIEKALKEHKIRGEPMDQTGFEMQTRPLTAGADERDEIDYVRASGHAKRSSLDGIKRRIGSLRRKKD